jgi:hypothetical protein
MQMTKEESGQVEVLCKLAFGMTTAAQYRLAFFIAENIGCDLERSAQPVSDRRLRLVILESPYAGDIDANVEYARACVRDSLARGEAPIASHLLYTQPGILRDEIEDERRWGIDAGLAWSRVAEATVVYVDRGISRGMEYGIANAERAGRTVERRTLAFTATEGK